MADKIASETTPLGSISYTYDEVGRRKTMQFAGQPVVNYDYYDNGRPQAIRQVIDSIERKFNFEYDDGGRRSYLKYFKGTDTNPTMTTVYSYDNANRLLNLQHLNPAQQVLESIGYTYDANGNRINMTRPSVTLPSREPVSTTSYNDANQMLTFDDKNIVYDDNGNMTSVTNSCGTTTYSWNVRNQLVGISGFKADCSSLTAAFNYDALGRRIQKTISVTGTVTDTLYLYDGLDIIQEKNSSGTVTANYIRTLNIDEPLMRIKGTTIRHYKQDALGSVIQLTDDSGTIKTTYKYDPFGNVTVSGEASDNPFQYTGRENDGTGLYYYRARYYSPELQRFISEDPIGLAGGINQFAYVKNRPTRFIDPLGLVPPPNIPPGVDMKTNIDEARNMSPLDFYNAVRNSGKWDYKQMGKQYEDFGNYNYGATGRAAGFCEEPLKRGAGAAQRAAGTSNPAWGTPWGSAPYGDDPKDQYWINEGINDYNNGYYYGGGGW